MDDTIEARLGQYLVELQLWGRRVNLVGSTELPDLQVHVRDSLAGARLLPSGARVVDLGSGAGLPGLPMAIARPDVSFVLVEARERRVHFLRHVARTLGLACEVRRQRIEEGLRDAEAGFDVATARAVGPAPEVLRAARSWVSERGEVWLWTRESAADVGALEGAQHAIDAEGTRGHILRVPALAIPRGT